MRPRRVAAKWLRYVSVAASAHLALILAIRPLARTRSARLEQQPATETDLDVEPQVEATRASPPPVAALDEEVHAGQRAIGVRTLSSSVHAEGAPAERGEHATEATPSEPPSTESGSGSAWTFDPRRPVDVTTRDFVTRATQAPSRESPTEGVSMTGGLVEGLDAHDAAIGMGRGGPVLSALEVAAAGMEAPFEGGATIDISIDTSGHVSVAVVDASADSSSWSKVANTAAKALDPSRVRIPPGAHGWHVVARVEAKVRYPSGLAERALGTTVESTPPSIKETKDQVVITLPSTTLAVTGKICSVRLTLGTLSPISGGCTLENMGARPLRIVHAHTVSEGRL